jgi:hypothetical protein
MITKLQTQLKLTCLLVLLLSGTSYLHAQDWDEIIKVTASDRGQLDFYGYKVSISGDYAIAGALSDKEDVNGLNILNNAGSAYILKRNADGKWVQEQKLCAADRGKGDSFSSSVSISGSYAIVGASKEDDDANGANPLDGAGSAYIFERGTDGKWTQVKKLTAPNRASDDAFGCSVSISGNYAIIGAEKEDEDANEVNTKNAAGSAYIYKRNNEGNWNMTQKLTASHRTPSDYFGSSVSISGNYVIISCRNDDEDANENNYIRGAGSAYIFERSSDDKWTQTQKLTANVRSGTDGFGNSVFISGNYAIVGAFMDGMDTNNKNEISYAGSAYIFERNTDGSWSPGKKLIANDRGIRDYFGHSLSISGDWALIAASDEDEDAQGENTISNAGASYLFKRDVSGNWVQAQKLVASDRSSNDLFGCSVAISGTSVIVGAYTNAKDANGENNITAAGSAYIFDIKQSQSITFPPLSSMVYGDADADGSATATSGLAINYSSSDENIATIVDGKIHTIAPGNVTIYAEQAGNYTYKAAPRVSQGLSINTKELTVTNASILNKEYDGNTNATITGATLSGVINSDAVSLSNATEGTFAQTSIGTNISVANNMNLSGADADKYKLTKPTLSGNIVAKEITVTADADVSKVYGESDPAYTYKSNRTLVGSDVFSGELSRESGDNAGTYAITQGTLSLNANYKLNFVSNNFEITKAPLEAKAENATKKVGEDNPVFTIAYDGFVLGDDESAISDLPVASCAAKASSPIGDYDIVVSGGSADNYYFEYVKGTLTIDKATAIDNQPTAIGKVWPNPTKGLLNISQTFIGEPYKVCSLAGTIVKQGSIIESSIDLSDLNNGIYLLIIDRQQFKVIKK